MESGLSIDISLEGGQIRLAPNRDLLPSHDMFLTAIIGFQVSADAEGPVYLISATAEAGKSLSAVKRFFNEKKIVVTLDSYAEELITGRNRSNQLLAAARTFGDALHRAPPTSIELSPTFLRTLKPYQVPAVAHMVGIDNVANFSVPGSGKTTMALAAYSILKAAGIVNQLLVIGPRSCFAPWEEEFRGCFQRDPISIRLTGTPADRIERYRQLYGDSVDFALVTYATAANDSALLVTLLQAKRVMLVLDESHYVKRASGGLWARTVRDLAPFASRRVVLTGTPVPNGILDIWSQMTFLWPDPPLLGSRERFTDRVQRGGEEEINEVREELLPLFWRVRKSDVDLPAPTFHPISVVMRPYQAAIYQALGVKVLSDIVAQPKEREKLRRWRTAKMVRLLQAASNPSLLTERSPEFRLPPLNAAGLAVSELIANYSEYEKPAKLDAAVSLARELIAKDQKVVIWSSFVHNLKTLGILLADFQPRIIHGSVPRDSSEDIDVNREKFIEEFKTNDSYPLLIANPGACAESISLHRACKHAIYLDRTFNGAQYMQSLDRIHRLGLGPLDKVHYYVLTSAGTVDEVVDRRLASKQIKLNQLLEGDLVTVDLDDAEVSEATEEEEDFDAMVQQLRAQFGGGTGT